MSDDVERVKRLHATTDAQVWAREFNDVLATEYGIRVDEGWLIGWFANAIETARAKGRREAINAIDEQAGA